MAASAILKFKKLQYLAMEWLILTKFGTVVRRGHPGTVSLWNFANFKDQYGGGGHLD